MRKMARTVLMLSALSLCTLMTTDAFGCQQQDNKRRKMTMYTPFSKLSYPVSWSDPSPFAQMPADMKNVVFSQIDTMHDFCNVANTSKTMRSYVAGYVNNPDNIEHISQRYIASADLHDIRMGLFQRQLRNDDTYEEIRLYRDVARRWGTIQERTDQALIWHNQGIFNRAISHSRLALAIPIPPLPQDEMIVEEA